MSHSALRFAMPSPPNYWPVVTTPARGGTIQELLGHSSVETTIPARRDTHVLNSGGRGVRSPLDQLGNAAVNLSRPS